MTVRVVTDDGRTINVDMAASSVYGGTFTDDLDVAVAAFPPPLRPTT